MINNNKQSGFTVVELMISTIIFSMVLLLLTSGVIGFTKAYYKGITETNTQRISRTIVESITQSIQLNSGFYTPSENLVFADQTWHGFCIGNDEYIYKLGYQLNESGGTLKTNQTDKALLKVNTGGVCSAAALTWPSEEMLLPSMRLADLSVTLQSNGLYKIVVTVVSGDDDLLTNPTLPTASCNSNSGSQFCAVSGLSTVVQKRIQQ